MVDYKRRRAMTVLISKADFMAANLVKFSNSIEDNQLSPYIYAAQEYELEPRLGASLYGDLVTYAESPTGQRPELEAFLKGPVRRYLVLASYRRFISAHGMNVTQFGLTKTADPQGTFSQAEATERAVIIRQIDSDCKVALLKMTSVSFVFDGVSYEKGKDAGRPTASIRAPKRRGNDLRPHLDNYYNRYL